MGNAVIDFSVFMAITVVEGKLYCFVLVCDVVFCLYVGGATIGSFVSIFTIMHTVDIDLQLHVMS